MQFDGNSICSCTQLAQKYQIRSQNVENLVPVPHIPDIVLVLACVLAVGARSRTCRYCYYIFLSHYSAKAPESVIAVENLGESSSSEVAYSFFVLRRIYTETHVSIFRRINGKNSVQYQWFGSDIVMLSEYTYSFKQRGKC